LFLTAIITPLIEVNGSLKFFVEVFFLAGFVAVTYMVLSSLVKIMYPRFLENRLLRIRNKTRISAAGNRMRKLSSDEEQVHLEGSQLTARANEIHSVEYDVWLDEKTGEKRIEKYLVSHHADKCNECGFYTMKIDTEELVNKPNSSEPGLLIEHYRCSYCNHREAKQVIVAALSTNVLSAAN